MPGMGRMFALAGAATVLTLGTGCPKPYPNCESDEACKEHNEVCVQGQCRECATDAQCKAGFVCDPASFRCVPKPECATDVDCGDGKKCQAGRCVAAVSERPAGTCEADTDCPSGQACESGRCVTSKACDYSAIRFGFNEYALSSEAQSRLRELADCIRAEQSRVTIEGHADERGTEEYNLQLSNRRASSVKKYLVDLGVASKSLDTVGFGEERPAAQGSSESAWATNRRVEFSKR